MAETSNAVGKRLVIRVAAIAVSMSALNIVFVNVLQGTDGLPKQLVRLCLTLVLCHFLIRGRPLARWISIVLFLAGGVSAVLYSLARISHHVRTAPV